MRIVYQTLLISLLLSSCSDIKTSEKDLEKDTNEDIENQTVEEMAHRHVQSQLSIPSTEKYSLKIYKEHLDGDTKIDAVITVNRLEYALNEAKKSGKYEQLKEVGFIGSYNYIFYFDGGLNQISPAINCPSSPGGELIVNFENILTDVFKDILIDYKIRNSSFRNYYSVVNHTPKQIFQWKLYDYLGEKNTEANFIEYTTGSTSLAKDILIYEGELMNSKGVNDIYNFNPEISKKGKLLHRFFFLENEGKYFTKK